jgi:capsular exopolysaccharide synthesis family protein
VLEAGPNTPRSQSNDLRSFLAIIGARWLTVLLVVLASVGVAAALSLPSGPPMQQSDVKLIASSSSDNSSQAYQANQLAEERLATYVNLVEQPQVMGEVVNRLGLSESPAELGEQVSASVTPNTVILTIRAQAEDPRQSERIAQTTADVFLGFVDRLNATGGTSTDVRLSPVGAASPAEPLPTPSPLRNIAIAAVLGLVLGCGVALLRHFLDNTVSDATRVEELTGAPVVGTIPDDRSASSAPLLLRDDHTARAEAFRGLRTNLRHPGGGYQGSVFVVASSVPGEAKTTTALNLALMMSKAGRRVALVEADLRRPLVDDYVPVNHDVGLTTVLLGEATLEQALQQPYAELPLFVLPSGRPPSNPAELLESDDMAATLGKLRESFDSVVVDASPLGPVADGAVVATLGDATLLVVRHGHTKTGLLEQSVHRLRQVDAPVSGVVLTRVPRRRGKSQVYGGSHGRRGRVPA